ncbi:MAG: serine hydrolase domain-containing protein, partial [Anaerolineae bacterium]
GAVDLQAPVTDYVPQFDVSGPWPASDMAVWNLLTHSTGFPDRLFFTDIDGPRTESALTEWAGDQSEVRLYAPPGSFWNYSNPNFILAGLVAERASGIPYHEYVENNVWAAAGMTRTMFLPSEALAYGNYTYGHFTDPFTGEPVIIAPDAYDNWWAAPAGYAFSTPGDLVKWALLLMDGGGDVLSPESAAAMQAEQIWLHYTPTQYYGYGVLADEFWGVETRDHPGNVPGWGSTLLWVPERNFAVSVLGNTTSSMYSSLYCATAVMLGLQPPQNPPDYSTDPDTWGRYVGTYDVLDYEVLDPAGIEFEAVVTKEEDDLRLSFPTLRDPLTLTAPYSRTLTQAFLDTFLFDINLDGTPDLDLTFIDDPEAPGEVKWMRNRVFVGTRAAVPQGTDTLTVRAFVDYRCDGFFQDGLDAPLREASVRLSFPNGAWITRQVRPFGLVNFSGFDAADGVAVTVDLPEGYQGYALGHCPNSPGNIRLQSDDFQFGYKLVQFGAGVAGEAAGP